MNELFTFSFYAAQQGKAATRNVCLSKSPPSLPPYVDLRCEFKIDGGVAAVAVVESIPTFKRLHMNTFLYLGGLLPLVSQAPSDRRVTHRGP